MNNASPLIQTVTPERWAGFSMDFIGAGYTGLLVKNGRAVRTLKSGRHFSFALPLLEPVSYTHLTLPTNREV